LFPISIFFGKLEKEFCPRFLDVFFSARPCARARARVYSVCALRAGRKLEIDFRRNSERYVEHVSSNIEISRLRNRFSAASLPGGFIRMSFDECGSPWGRDGRRPGKERRKIAANYYAALSA